MTSRRVLSLCDFTGNMVMPWLEAGYEATIVDLQHPHGRTSMGPLTKVGLDVCSGIGMSDKVSGGHIKTTSSREETAPEQAQADHCPPEVPCTCETAADLGFSGWGDGVNPNTIVSERPDCPLHGFKPCQYDGCPFPENPRYDHNHPPDRREVQCAYRRPHAAHLWLWSPSEKVRCWGVAEVTAEEYNSGDYDGDFIDFGGEA